ncbi:alpha-2-macroglobulin [Sungkyunkwania multivorans]|uniref:Alpha-2-macroglobulin n=2 Tax=Sungkyunkwania multivorans TaxID=1173618 RepID=A0ABW3CZR2_9FLAO
MLSILSLSIFSCKKKTEEDQNRSKLYEYSEYVSDVSSGLVSTAKPIKVVLVKPVESWSPDTTLDNSLLAISPKADGKVMALNNRTIAFVPETPLKPDTEYTLSLNLGKIQDVPKDFKRFDFVVKTIKQQFNVVTETLQSYSKDWQYINGAIKTSDVMDGNDAKKLLEVTQDGRELPLKFDAGVSTEREFQFTIDSIQRFVDDSEIVVRWSGKSLNIDNEGEAVIEIPGKSNFKILDVEVFDNGQQSVEINFSDPVKKSQNFNGLVAIQGAKNLKYSVDGNVLKVFSNKDIKGSAKLEVFSSIQSTDGYRLKQDYSELISFEQLKPELSLLQSGTILPGSDNLKVNFSATNLKAVDVMVYRIFQNNVLQFLQQNNLTGRNNLRMVARPIAQKTLNLQDGGLNLGKKNAFAVDISKLIQPEPGAIYRVEFNYKKAYSAYKCDEVSEEDEEAFAAIDFDNEEPETSFWDDNNYYESYYGYNWNERENPCHTTYYYDKKVGVNVLATNLGAVVKKGVNNAYFIVVTNLITAQPETNAQVEFFNLQQQSLGVQTTDEEGKTILDAETPAYFAVVSKGNERTYVKLSDGNALSLSKFNVSGARLQKGLKGYLYGERGVWRPGDTLFLSFMLNDNANKLPANHPVKFELKNPYGKVTHREVQTNGVNNFYKFVIQTDQEAPTGNWQATARVGGATFTENIKIETIKPNRLKIKAGFENDVIYSGEAVDGTLEVTWLHGAVARNLKADINARFSQTATSFENFPGYTFDDPARRFNTEDFTVFDGKIGNDGKATFNLKPQLRAKAPGMLRASFITKVYENGGDFSTDVFSSTYSPYSTYVGINAPKGDKARGMLLTDQDHTFEIATVTEKGTATAVKDLTVKVYRVNWRWWWNYSDENLSTYAQSNYHTAYKTLKVSTNANGKASFDLKISEHDWGRYLIRVEDPKGKHATGKVVYFDWPGWAGKARKNDPSSATMLVFSADKDTYNVGETATVSFPSGGTGRALVTVENGTEVLDAMWVTPKKGETKFTIPIDESYTPNVYINITLLQPHSETGNDLPIRMYGVIPISVEDPNTRLSPTLTMPEVLRPEETIKLKVAEENGKAMTYSIAIVDEGLLDLTRFKTPNPWDRFYAREALGVKTWDIYDDVVGAYGGRIDQIFSIGGDGEAAGSKNKKANRFKPMVVYKGPFTLDKGETKEHQIKIPKYVGSVRTMVVAGNATNAAYGNVEKTTPVKKPLMVLASLPRKITPGEKVTLPVTVFAGEKKVKNVTVKVRPHPSFKVLGENSQAISFSEPDEKMAYFDLDIAEYGGIGKVIVEASGNGEKASFEVEIDVVNPNPVSTEYVDVLLEPNSSKVIDIETFGTLGSNKAAIELSSLPPMNFTGRLNYLIRYPHGCVEQTTSGVFPQLFLTDIFELPSNKKRELQKNIEAGIKRLARFQTGNGGFAYWPGQSTDDDWSSSYAGHFLLEAEKKGYVLPIAFKQNWIRYQKQAAKRWRKKTGLYYRDDLAQAYRLYTLALAGSPDLSSMNRMRETNGINNESKIRLAAAYALAGQKSAAEKILATANFSFTPSRYYYGYGSLDRNRAMALETLTVVENKSEAFEQAKKIAENLSSSRWMSTQSCAYSLLAMSKFAETFGGGKGIDVSYTLNSNASNSINTSKTLSSRDLDVKQGANTVTLKNNKDNTIFVRVLTSGILPVGQEKIAKRNLSTSIRFKAKDGSLLNVDQLSQGTDFVAEVTISNQSDERVEEVALSQILPSGWEIVNTRFTDFGSFAENKAEYIDIRDDRTNFYFDLKRGESRTFRMLLNASYLGKYYLPGVQAEAMYDNEYFVRTAGKWIEVTK